MAQWASAYAESALGLSKSIGDIAGPCLFAVMMGISRTFYGKYGEKIDLTKFMIASGTLCLICYLAAALAPYPLLNLIGCVVCGFSVGIMWPGTISISSSKFHSAELHCLHFSPWPEIWAVPLAHLLLDLSHKTPATI